MPHISQSRNGPSVILQFESPQICASYCTRQMRLVVQANVHVHAQEAPMWNTHTHVLIQMHNTCMRLETWHIYIT